MDVADDPRVQQFANWLSESRRVFVVTGAGISAESGLPTYRGVGGLYNNGETEDGMPIEVALSGPVFQTQPEVTWKYLRQIEGGAQGKTFNRGHQVLAEMAKQYTDFWILTQNVDGFHSAAGSPNVIEIHGNLHRLRCEACGHRENHEDYSGFDGIPACPACSSTLRPDVVLFEESLPLEELRRLDDCGRIDFDLVISIGTSSHFPYILQPILVAQQLGVRTVEINPARTLLSDEVELYLPRKAGETLEAAWKMVQASA